MNKLSENTITTFLKRSETTSVSLDKISIPEVVAVFSYPRSGENLKDSLKSNGFINPVIVSESAQEIDSEYLVICGAKRIYAARELGLASVPVNIISDKPRSEKKRCLKLPLPII